MTRNEFIQRLVIKAYDQFENMKSLVEYANKAADKLEAFGVPFDEAQGTPAVKKNQQDSAWSGEDDVRQTSTIQVLEYAKSLDDYNQYGKIDIRNNIIWLKDLKDRVQSQPKRGWSEEDEKRRENVIRLIEEANNMYIKEWGSSPFSSDILWLKSLKDRHTWRPSDEQIYNMEAAIRAIKYGENVTAYRPILEEILDDLKKIKD